ncbi:MAG: carboxypeptidase-like regulatory domain-containing protein [Bacteroidales bacterium]
MQGKIICRNNGEPVMMATVVVKELNIWATTNDSGEFVLRNVPPGTPHSGCIVPRVCSA